MARDLEKQHSGLMTGGAKVDFGYASFCANSWTVDIPIYLTVIRHAHAEPKGDTYGYVAKVNLDTDVSRGFITASRETAKIDVSVDFFYEIKGY